MTCLCLTNFLFSFISFCRFSSIIKFPVSTDMFHIRRNTQSTLCMPSCMNFVLPPPHAIMINFEIRRSEANVNGILKWLQCNNKMEAISNEVPFEMQPTRFLRHKHTRIGMHACYICNVKSKKCHASSSVLYLYYIFLRWQNVPSLLRQVVCE